MKKLRISLVLLLVLGAFGLYHFFARPRWQKELQASPTLILYSLEPRRESLPAHLQKHARYLKHAGSYVLDEVVVSSQQDKQLIVAALQASIRSDGSEPDSLFHLHSMKARHAVGTPDGRTFISVCYECGMANFFGASSIFSDEEGNFLPINPAEKPLFDALLQKYHLRQSDATRNKTDEK